MDISRYGISLNRLTIDHIEMVRNWRNATKISRFMFFRKHITSAMQQKWFESIDSHENFYFVISYQNESVGLIDIASINWDEGTAKAGLFIYEEKYWGTSVPVFSSLALLDVFFLVFGLKEISAKVLGENQAAIRYNQQLGFEINQEESDKDGFGMQLTKSNYLEKAKSLRCSAGKIKGSQTVISITESNFTGIEIIREKLESVDEETSTQLSLTIK